MALTLVQASVLFACWLVSILADPGDSQWVKVKTSGNRTWAKKGENNIILHRRERTTFFFADFFPVVFRLSLADDCPWISDLRMAC